MHCGVAPLASGCDAEHGYHTRTSSCPEAYITKRWAFGGHHEAGLLTRPTNDRRRAHTHKFARLRVVVELWMLRDGCRDRSDVKDCKNERQWAPLDQRCARSLIVAARQRDVDAVDEKQ